MSDLSLSVRALATFVFRSGDLYPIRVGKPVEAEQGIKMQKRLQAQLLHRESYVAEKLLELGELPLGDGAMLTIRGRADGIDHLGEEYVVEEYKCVRGLPSEPDPVDRGQLLIYCAMQSVLEPDCAVSGRLIYADADSEATRSFKLTLSESELRGCLALVLTCFCVRWQRHLLRACARRDWGGTRDFPMQTYRTGQAAVARRVYRALRDQEHLLLEAPTGSGKSLAVTFGAIKGLAEDEQLFFLTSRNAGAAAAIQALNQIDPGQHRLVFTELQAKEKMCPIEGMPCRADRCDRARGYFDRLPAAVDHLLDLKACESDAIRAVADVYTLCPFELSLDVSIWSDVIVGDYNYIFDPVVRLNRFVARPGVKLVIDEAHQLFPRAADMLSVSFAAAELAEPKSSQHEGIARRARSIDRAMKKIASQFGEGTHEVDDEALAPFERAVDRLLEDEALLELEFLDWPELASMYFLAHRWRRASGWLDKGGFAGLCIKARDGLELRRHCLDSSPYVRGVLDEYPASVRLSATVSPGDLYQRLHGCDDQPFERGQNPFAVDQVGVFHVQGISTLYRHREASIGQLRRMLIDLYNARPGHYLVAFPSYAYLDQVLEEPLEGIPSHRQTSSLTLESLIDEFRTLSGFLGIVMGGSLGESVDFTGLNIAGVILIGIGLPPPSVERDLRARYFDEDSPGLGQQVAYTQPALAKAMQAAGRLIRDPKDRGIICLVDARFSDRAVQQFFPAYWRPKSVPAGDIGPSVQAFWRDQAKRREL